MARLGAKLAHARDAARMRLLERGVSEKTMATNTTSTFATLASSDLHKGGVAAFGGAPMKPVLASEPPSALVDKLMLVHELSAALYEGARPRDEVLCGAWMDAIGEHRYVETNHPVRPGEVLRGEVEVKGASSLSVSFNPRCATVAGAALTLTYSVGKEKTTLTYGGPARGAEGGDKAARGGAAAWPAEPVVIKASKLAYAFSAPGGEAASEYGVGFTVSPSMTSSARATVLARQIAEVVFASKQLLTNWTPAMDADLVRLAGHVAAGAGEVEKAKDKKGSDSDSDGSDSDDSSAARKAPKYKLSTLPLSLLELRADVDSLSFASLEAVPVPQLRMRFALIRAFNALLRSTLACFSLSSTRPWSVGYRLRHLSHCVFAEVKSAVLESAIRATSGDGHIDTMYLSNFKASESEARGDVAPETSRCMFVQAYYWLRKYPSAALRTYCDEDQRKVFEVQFVGESGIDAGGVYREGLSRIIDDLFSERFNLLIPCPNRTRGDKVNADSFVPNPAHRTPLALSMLEFLGRMLGLSLRSKAALSFAFPSLVWKALVGERPRGDDLLMMDTAYAEWLRSVRECDADLVNGLPRTPITTQEAFAAAFPDLRFCVTGTDGKEVELVPGGRGMPVTFASRARFADAAEHFRLHEFDTQLAAIRRGLANMVPIRALSLFTWQECEVLVAGSADVDVAVLKKNTEYEGSYSKDDPVVHRFWRAMAAMTGEERSLYLRFVWGRARLPGEGTHWSHTISEMSGGDKVLPLAHTCFCTIDLPRYTTDERMLWGLRTAVHYGLGGSTLSLFLFAFVVCLTHISSTPCTCHHNSPHPPLRSPQRVSSWRWLADCMFACTRTAHPFPFSQLKRAVQVTL